MLALHVNDHARFKIMIPMMILFRFQGLGGCSGDFHVSCLLGTFWVWAEDSFFSTSYVVHSFERKSIAFLVIIDFVHRTLRE